MRRLTYSLWPYSPTSGIRLFLAFESGMEKSTTNGEALQIHYEWRNALQMWNPEICCCQLLFSIAISVTVIFSYFILLAPDGSYTPGKRFLGLLHYNI
jgi:hypothetical protein